MKKIQNLTVRNKILVAFLVVILMIAALLGTTVFTSLTRNSDLERVDKMNEIQRKANTLLDNFNLARVEIRTVFSSIEAESEYYLALDYLDTCVGLLDEMDVLSAELGGYLTDELQITREMFGSMRAGLVGVGDNDEITLAAIEKMHQAGLTMSGSSDALFDLVTKLSLEIAAGDATAGVERIENVLVPTKYLQDRVDMIKVLSRSVELKQDISVIPELNTNLETLKEEAAVLRAAVSTDEARAAIDEVVAAADDFGAAINEVNETMTHSEALIAAATAQFLELNEVVGSSVSTVAADVGAMTDKTIQSSFMVMLIMIGVGIFAMVFSIVAAIILAKSITRPLNKMKDVMLSAGERGVLKFSNDVMNDLQSEIHGKDETGQTIAAFGKLLDHIIKMAGILERVADKDLSMRVDLLSEEDTMGLSLEKMLDNLNRMFHDIGSIASQVSTASGEISIGAQSLAQGSTEQASTIQQISASVVEIDEQMSVAADKVQSSVELAGEITSIAKEGNGKMEQLSGSMQDINDASQNIGNVIKVIDDIAFQTNILALNAAVEAARAGEHGKGFAVVADEVRNLAGKSAEAAKETAELISANIEKTEQGMVFTTETAESLSKIMEGVGKTDAALHDVAVQAESVKTSIGQVSLASGQVSQVVQQNSATSEQSAAASQEMSSQAQVLNQMVAEFSLRDDKSKLLALPPTADGTVAGQPVDESRNSDNTIIF